MTFKRSLFIFRRDLRLQDNTGLLKALESSNEVMACFIFDTRQIGNQKYFGSPAAAFMVQSLHDLAGQLKEKSGRLYIFSGLAHEVVNTLIKKEKIEAVFVNEDYTPFSKRRDEEINDVCVKNGTAFHKFHDTLLNDPNAVRKDDGGIYTVFTPYARKAGALPVAAPRKNTAKNYRRGPCPLEDRRVFDELTVMAKHHSAYPGGRSAGLKILLSIKRFNDYEIKRNVPAFDATTKLSAHHKFGTISARETYHTVCRAFGPAHPLIRELYWRDFFTQIGCHFPHVLGNPFDRRYKGLRFENDPLRFKAWCLGMTGFPLVDAGMRELNATGFMHNRLRMIAASFLVKDLRVDWRWGEKYFAQHLVDYDPLVNNGNWQWAASTGCDAAPYFRVFNPWLQQKKFDPDAVYIKRWVAPLKDLPVEMIHGLSKKNMSIAGYPIPIVDHDEERIKTLAMYQRIRRS